MPLIDRRAVTLGLASGMLTSAVPGLSRTPDAAAAYPTNVVTQAARIVREQYVDPPMADRLADLLLANLRAGRYRNLQRAMLARRLTDDLRSLSSDLHLEVVHEPPVAGGSEAAELTEDEMHPRTTGWGIQTVARLQGNVGLLKVTHFPSPPFRFGSHYGAAMELLRDTAALILDLTINHGGGTDTFGYFMSYFLDGDVEFGRIRWRNDPIEIVRTSREIQGTPYGEERPIFVAISANTFSAGEGIAQELKARRRAVLVGGRTRGGAHSGRFVGLPEDFRIFVVMGRGDGPDWEGVGVAPDVEAPPGQAVAVAHRMAVDRLLADASDSQRRQILRNVAAGSIENLSSFAFR